MCLLSLIKKVEHELYTVYQNKSKNQKQSLCRLKKKEELNTSIFELCKLLLTLNLKW